MRTRSAPDSLQTLLFFDPLLIRVDQLSFTQIQLFGMNGADLEMVATLLAAKHLDALRLKDWALAAFSLYQDGQLDDPASFWTGE